MSSCCNPAKCERKLYVQSKVVATLPLLAREQGYTTTISIDSPKAGRLYLVSENGDIYWDSDAETWQADWSETDPTSNSFIRNKPIIPTIPSYTVATDVSISHTTGTDVYSLVNDKVNLITGVTSSTTATISLASSTDGGLMPKESFTQIATNASDILTLKQQGGRYIGQSFATVAQLEAFTIPASVNIGDFTFVLDDEDHDDATTRYICVDNGGNKEFQFAYIINYDPVSNFDENVAGLITGVSDQKTPNPHYRGEYQTSGDIPSPTEIGDFADILETNTEWEYIRSGMITWWQDTHRAIGTTPHYSQETGKIFAENDGTGSVIGWDDLISKVDNKQNKISKAFVPTRISPMNPQYQIVDMYSNPGGRFKATMSASTTFSILSEDGDILILDLIITGGTPTFENVTLYQNGLFITSSTVPNTIIFKNNGGVVEGFLLAK